MAFESARDIEPYGDGRQGGDNYQHGAHDAGGGEHDGAEAEYGREGVSALASATPIDSGQTANSWYYKIIRNKNSFTISFHNSNIQNGVQ